jgi:hypothetical protein
MFRSIAVAVALGWVGAAWAEMTIPCTAQEDCSEGFYCHFPPRCDFDNVSCVGTCESTEPGGEGAVCNQYRMCSDGLACCYPCGVPGCERICTVPCDRGEPYCFGGCYLYP